MAVKIEEITPEKTIDTKLELIDTIAQVKSKIKEHITSDFILAKLGDKDKEAITELTANAYYGAKLLRVVEKTQKKWYWEDGKWIYKHLEEKDKEAIRQHSENLFSVFMVRVQMTVILNRNVKDNHMLRMMLGASDEPEEGTTEKDTAEGLVNKIKEKLKRED